MSDSTPHRTVAETYDTNQGADRLALVVGLVVLGLALVFVYVLLAADADACKARGGEWGASGGNTCASTR